VKKIDSSVNTVTLTAASGLIFDIGAGVASLSVGVQGENLQFQSDGTNIYIL
jgi:predicted amidohydrolase